MHVQVLLNKYTNKYQIWHVHPVLQAQEQTTNIHWGSAGIHVFSASHDKSVEIHWLNKPGLWSHRARWRNYARALSHFAQQSNVPQQEKWCQSWRHIAILRRKVSLYICYMHMVWRICRRKQINVMWCTKLINAWFWGTMLLYYFFWKYIVPSLLLRNYASQSNTMRA